MMSRKIKKYITNPKLILFWIIVAFPKLIKSDKLYLKLKYYVNFEKWPDLDNPQTFSEKLQWLKLNVHCPEYTRMVDKYEAKEYVANIIGREHIIPTLGVWNNPDDINWDKLPDQFVLKCTHDSGTIIVVKDKSKINRTTVVNKLKKGLNHNYYYDGREWPYKNVQPRIIAEQFVDPVPKHNDLPDYSFFCINGEPEFCQVITRKNAEMCIDFFDKEWHHQTFHKLKNYTCADPMPQKPHKNDKMWEMVRQLAEGETLSRIDLYNVGEDVFWGEITFFSTIDFGVCGLDGYDKIIGKMLDLPGEKRGKVILSLQKDEGNPIVQLDLYDYKFFTFNGEPRVLLFCSERKNGTSKWDFYDMEMNRINVSAIHHENTTLELKDIIDRDTFEQMKEYARILGDGKAFVSVDQYYFGGEIYFGELTFYSGSGLLQYDPHEFDRILGDMLELPIKNNE